MKQEELYRLKKHKSEDSKLSNCLLCGQDFHQSRNGLKLFCCTQHKRQFRRNKTSAKRKVKCKGCEVQFESVRWNNLFCSKRCAALHADNARYKNDINYRLAKIIRARLYAAMSGTAYRHGSVKYLGCTVDKFRLYMESKFEPWMNWDNYGKYDSKNRTWQIDHIKPLDSFDLTKIRQLKKACHYKNMQPLESIKNIIKSNK